MKRKNGKSRREQMTKIMAIGLGMLMVLGLAVPAFAQEETEERQRNEVAELRIEQIRIHHARLMEARRERLQLRLETILERERISAARREALGVFLAEQQLLRERMHAAREARAEQALELRRRHAARVAAHAESQRERENMREENMQRPMPPGSRETPNQTERERPETRG